MKISVQCSREADEVMEEEIVEVFSHQTSCAKPRSRLTELIYESINIDTFILKLNTTKNQFKFEMQA